MNHKKTLIVLILGVSTLLSCAAKVAKMDIVKEPFGKTENGVAVDLYTLTSDKAMTVKITNYGGIITRIEVPDRDGVIGDIVLGYDELDGYLAKTPYFGALCGRYANRIAGGKFGIDGTPYTLAQNNGPNALHGGLVGFDKRVWAAKEMIEATISSPKTGNRTERTSGRPKTPQDGSLSSRSWKRQSRWNPANSPRSSTRGETLANRNPAGKSPVSPTMSRGTG